jgi:hypothetical protein
MMEEPKQPSSINRKMTNFVGHVVKQAPKLPPFLKIAKDVE